MSISDKVVAAEQAAVEAKDKLVELTKSFDESADDAGLVAIEEQSEAVEKATQQLATYRKAESALASKAASFDAPSIVKSVKSREPIDYVLASAVCAFESFVTRKSFDQVMEERYGQDDHLKAVAGGVVKGASAPAMSNVDGWAAELSRESYGAFLDLLQPESVIPNVPMNRFEFQGFSAINIPGRAATPNLAGAFRAEGDPIPVKQAATMKTVLTPKSMGVISTFTQECLRRSTPSIEALIRKWIVEDTAVALDNQFLGNSAATTLAPAGLQNLAGSNTSASTGSTHDAIVADVKGMVQSMTASNLGRRPVWIMHPSNLIALNMTLTAVGTPAFPETASNSLYGMPVVTSTTVPLDVVYLVDASEMAIAFSGPQFLGTDVASVHMEDTTPLPIVDGAGTVAAPVRSLYQSNSSGLRMTLETDWSMTRDGAVVTLTSVDW
jgi:HK97 family phage major capsid protein